MAARVRFDQFRCLGVFAIVRAYLLARGRICARIRLRIKAGARAHTHARAHALVLIVKLFRQYPGFRFHSYIKDVRHGDIANK